MNWKPVKLMHLGVEYDGLTAQGDWVWEIIPALPNELWPDREDAWILRGRDPGRRKWKYFGGYQGLDNVKAWAVKEDTRKVSDPLYRRRYNDEREG